MIQGERDIDNPNIENDTSSSAVHMQRGLPVACETVVNDATQKLSYQLEVISELTSCWQVVPTGHPVGVTLYQRSSMKRRVCA